LETTRKWRWGINRWFILLFIILSIVAINLVAPVQPHIQVAPERILLEPLFNMGPLGDFYLVNTLPTLLIVHIFIIALAYMVRQSLRKGDLVPRGVAGAMEGLIEVLYNLTESSAGKHAKKIFPWFATILIFVLVANLMKLLPGMESIGVMHPYEHGHEIQALGGGWYNLLPGEAEVRWLCPYALLPGGFNRFKLHSGAGVNIGCHDPGDRSSSSGVALFFQVH